jgi:hypothetical protein
MHTSYLNLHTRIAGFYKWLFIWKILPDCKPLKWQALLFCSRKALFLAKSQIIVRQLESYFLIGSLPPIIKNANLASWLEAYPLTMKMFEYRSKLNSRARLHMWDTNHFWYFCSFFAFVFKFLSVCFYSVLMWLYLNSIALLNYIFISFVFQRK